MKQKKTKTQVTKPKNPWKVRTRTGLTRLSRTLLAGVVASSMILPFYLEAGIALADRVKGDIELKAESESEAHADTNKESDSDTGKGNAGAGGTAGSGAGANAGGGAGAGAGAGEGDVWAKADAVSQAIAVIRNGKYVELSAYLMESIQGLNRGTYVPNIDDLMKNNFLYEEDYAALRENRFFGEDNKREFFFAQNGKYSLEYTEALNWLYKNNMIHRFENIDVKYMKPKLEKNKVNTIKTNDANAGNDANDLDLTLHAGAYFIDYDMLSIPDMVEVYEDGKVIATTGKHLSDKGQLAFTLSKRADVTISMNKKEVKDGTAWSYAVKGGPDYFKQPFGKSQVTLTEDPDIKSPFYPYATANGQEVQKPMKRKDFIMQLMKVVDGVEESRPLMIQSQYASRGINGQVTNTTDFVESIRTMFKTQIGATGMDAAINSIDVDFKEYGMHYIYANPNVYELYLAKAYNSKIIEANEIKVKQIIDYVNNTTEYAGTNKPQEFKTETSCPKSTEKIGNPTARWDNKLPPVRINTREPVNNDYTFKTNSKTNIFGLSWTDSSPICSTDKVGSHSFKYKDYEYFNTPNLSYMDAVKYVYKAINAYSDEKLPQKEVDSIMSMYSINYGRLTETETTALNYLIAKGIIDGDNAAKFTSTENISVEDATIMSYRVANKSARLTFKTNFTALDQQMLSLGYGQSKTSLTTYENELPEMEITSEATDEYHIIMNETMAKNDYFLGTSKFQGLDSSVNVVTSTKSSEDLSELGVKMPAGSYTVKTYEIPWTTKTLQLGMTMNEANGKLPIWLDVSLGGGYYYASEDTMTSTGNLSLTKMNQYEAEKTDYDDVSDGDFEEGEDDNSDLIIDTSKAIPTNSMINRIVLPTYAAKKKEEGTLSIYIGVNETAKDSLFFDGLPLFKDGKINPKLIKADGDIKNINIVSDKVAKGDANKTFVEFQFPKTGTRTASELKSLLKRRLTLTGEAEAKDEDVASYTGIVEGETMISRKELKRFGITVSKEEPDILFQEKTNTYAYLNVDKDFALISNSVITFPKNTMMIEVTADDVYYNIKVVMSMLNNKDFYMFNEEGKVEIVAKMEQIKYQDILDPETGKAIDKTFSANVNEKSGGKLKTVGKFVNVSSISGKPATFFMSINKTKGGKKRIFGFEPYYVKTKGSGSYSATTEQVINELKLNSADIIEVENLIINNSIMRNQFQIPKSETFMYTDNAIKVTTITSSTKLATYASDYLDFIESVYEGASEKDVKVNAESLRDSSSAFRNKDFNLEDLMARNLFKNSDKKSLKALVKEAKSGSKYADAVWVLYFLDKFSLEIPYKIDSNGKHNGSQYNAFMKELVKAYNKRYKLPSSVKISDADDLAIMRTSYKSETDIRDKRVYIIKRMLDNPNGYLSHDKNLFLGKNDTIYVPAPSYSVSSNGAEAIMSYSAPVQEVVNKLLVYRMDLDKFAAPDDTGDGDDSGRKGSASINSAVPKALANKVAPVKDMLGTAMYFSGNKLYAPIVEQYRSLPSGETPLESYPNGHKFKMQTKNGLEEFVLVNNMVTLTADKKEYVMAKIARVKTKKVSSKLSGKDGKAKLLTHYKQKNLYKNSKKTLGDFSSAVYGGTTGMNYTIRADEITRSLTNYDVASSVYFDYASKAKNSVYIYPTNLMNKTGKTKYVVAYPRNSLTYEISTNMLSPTTKLIFGNQTLANIKQGKSTNISSEKYLYKKGTEVKENFMVYDSFLMNYGSISLNYEGKASLNQRSDYILNKAPVLTDLVNELVKAVKKDRAEVKVKRIGDLVYKDKVMLLEGKKGSSKELVLLKTSEKGQKGYAHFMSESAPNNKVTATEMRSGNTLLLKNYSIFESIRINTGTERLPFYYFIGNLQLNVAPSSMIEQYDEYLSLGGSQSLIVEEGNEVREFKAVVGSGKPPSISGSTKAIPNDRQGVGMNYFLSLYVDNNLEVKLNDKGYYEVIGYADNELVNTEAFSSRAGAYKGIYEELLTVLPVVQNIDGRFLGFNLEKLAIEDLMRVFTFAFWENLLTEAMANVEAILSMLGIYYVYMLMVLVTLGRTAGGPMYRWILNPVAFMTFGKLDIETVNLTKFYIKCVFVLVLLTLTYNGFIRIIIFKAEDIRVAFYDFFLSGFF